MLSSAPARPAATDMSFFSERKTRQSQSGVSVTPTVVVTRMKRVATKPQATPSTLATSSSSRSASSSLEPPMKKRKTTGGAARDTKSTRSQALRPPTEQPTRKRGTSSSASSLRHSSRSRSVLSPEPIYRTSRSRSTTSFPADDNTPVSRELWVEEDGLPGEGFISCEEVVKSLAKTYISYFDGEAFQLRLTDEGEYTYPVAELQYPNSHGCEKFALLQPKDKDHYNPIMCLKDTLFTIIECYLTPQQRALFGSLPTLSDDEYTPSPPSSQGSTTSSMSTLTALSTASVPDVNHLRLFQRAIHRRDGAEFLKHLQNINDILISLKYPHLPPDLSVFEPSPENLVKKGVRSWTPSGVPQKVLLRILEETYQRAVGPHVASLQRYEAFSSTVYGELMPSFTSDIITAAHLGPDSLFLDLGSGVGNVVCQASLQSGCRSFGIEIMPTPAKVARSQLEQFKTRCRMWGVGCGEIELEEGDMLTSVRVTELISQADLILVNNKVFSESLIEALRPRFLDLKEGAIVVSLKPFVSSLNARVTERNIDDISAIFDVTERQYHSGSVSWGSGGGSYYLHRVDRTGYAHILERFENSRSSSRASRRR